MLAIGSASLGQIKKSENFEVTIHSLPQYESSGLSLKDAIYMNGNYYLVISRVIRGPGGFEYFIEQYNEAFELEKSRNITAQFDSKSVTNTSESFRIFRLINLKGKIGLVNHSYDESSRVMTHYYYDLNLSSLNLENQRTIHTQENVFYSYQNSAQSVISDDGNFLMICLVNGSRQGGSDKEFLEFSVFDDELNLLYEHKDIDLFERKIISFTLNPDASATIVSIDPKKWRQGNEDKKVFIVDYFDEDAIEASIDLTEFTPNDITIVKKNDFTYCLAGYFEEEGDKGIFYTEYNLQTKQRDLTISEVFEDDFLSEERIPESSKTGNTLSKNTVESIILHENGKISIVGSRTMINLGSFLQSNSFVSTVVDGEFQDHTVLEKFTVATASFNSVDRKVFLAEDYLSILFLDNRENLIDIDEDTGPLKCEGENKSKSLSVSVFDGEEVSRELILDFGESERKKWSLPNFITDTHILDNGEILLWIYTGKRRYVIAKVSPNF